MSNGPRAPNQDSPESNNSWPVEFSSEPPLNDRGDLIAVKFLGELMSIFEEMTLMSEDEQSDVQAERQMPRSLTICLPLCIPASVVVEHTGKHSFVDKADSSRPENTH